jgi:hypothetical protein
MAAASPLTVGDKVPRGILIVGSSGQSMARHKEV